MSDTSSNSANPPGRLGLAPSAPKAGRPASAPERSAPAGPPARLPRLKPPPLSLQGWILRLVMALFLFGAGFLALWSYQRLVPVQRQAREAASLASRLSGEIAVMEGRYSAEEIAELMQSYDRVKGLLFSTPEALKEWFQQVQLQMVPLALDATADFGRAVITNSASHKLAVVPATLSLNIQPASQVEAVRSPYERLLRFLDELGRQGKRVDLVELQVTGGSNSISRAVAMLQLWAGEEAKP